MDEVIEKKVKKVKEKIYKSENVYSSGIVSSVSSNVVEVSGLNDISFYEEVSIGGNSGYVLGIYYDKVIVALTNLQEPIMIGDEVVATKHIINGLFSLDSIGKVVDIFGHDLISDKCLDSLAITSIVNEPTSIMTRCTVSRELLTGITAIDMLYPIYKGQGQLIIGDRGTGKTQIALDTIVNQKDKNVLCFYVALGKSKREVKEIYQELTKRGANLYTTIFAAFNSDLESVVYLTPYIVMSIAETLMMQGYDILVVIDDLNKHANAYRSLSLECKKIPGVDGYPADMFYAQARMLESSAERLDGGSITIMPIVEDKKDYITSNILSMCDGQIVLSKKLFDENRKPAIDYNKSLSRISSISELSDTRILSNVIKKKLITYLGIKGTYELSNSELFTEDIKRHYEEGKKILNALNQDRYSPKSMDEMKSMFHFLDDGGTR